MGEILRIFNFRQGLFLRKTIMEKLNTLFQKIQSSIQVVVDGLISLAFQPIYFIIAIIQSIIDVWNDDDNEEETQNEEPNPNVTTYSSANDGCRGPEEEWECDYPLGRIGFKINQKEQEEIQKIKEQLNTNQN